MKDDLEHDPFIHYGNGSIQISSTELNNIRTRIDTYAKATLDSVILKLNETKFRQERLEKEQTIRNLSNENIYKEIQFEKDCNNNLIPDAAHDRTDIKPTAEMKKHDDDLMDNDEFWGK